jgi:uncharacterized protein (TIGR02466 family)
LYHELCEELFLTARRRSTRNGYFLSLGLDQFFHAGHLTGMQGSVRREISMQIIHQDLFPTRIWIFDIPELQDAHASWIQEVLNWRVLNPQPAGRSNRKGWNSDPTVFSRAEFKPLLDAANQAFMHVFTDMRPPLQFKFALQAWINLHDPGSYNALHVHANVLLSGCYYLKVPEGSGPIRFRDPRPGVVLSPFVEGGVNTCKDIVLHPKDGQLVIFPNWLDHAVDVHEGNESRISIAINAYEV